MRSNNSSRPFMSDSADEDRWTRLLLPLGKGPLIGLGFLIRWTRQPTRVTFLSFNYVRVLEFQPLTIIVSFFFFLFFSRAITAYIEFFLFLIIWLFFCPFYQRVNNVLAWWSDQETGQKLIDATRWNRKNNYLDLKRKMLISIVQM